MSLSLLDLTNELGVPREGIHKTRFNLLGLDVALVDFVGTIVLGVIVAIIVGLPFYIIMGLHRLKGYDMFIFWISIIIPSIIYMFIVGIILHRIFGVKTAIKF